MKLNNKEDTYSHSHYLEWIQKICAAKGIHISKEITQIKDGKLLRISSSVGNLYLKKTGDFIVDELRFTLKLMELRIISQPEVIGWDYDMNVCLMRDIGGDDLTNLPQLSIETAINMFISLAHIQKDSVRFVMEKSISGFDYRISTMLDELKTLPEYACKMLSETPYRLSQSEAEKLKHNTEYAKTILKSLENNGLPNIVHHGDLGTYNVRIVDGKSIFYDWGCGGVSHPFFDTFRLLYSIRGKLPVESAKEMIIDAYVQEWLAYGSHEEIKNIFSAVDGLAGFYMAYVKYIRARNQYLLYTEKSEKTSMDAIWMDERHNVAATYLREFIANNFRF